MAKRGLAVLDDLNASEYNMLTIDEFGDMLHGDFGHQLGAQFEGIDAGFGGFGSYPDLESEARDIADTGPYFVQGNLQDAFTATEGHSQFVMPAKGQPHLVEEISAEMPGLSSNTPSVSESSGEARTPPATPATPTALPLLSMKKGYERASAVKRRHQMCECIFPECNNKTFTRKEGLERHYESRHNLADEQYQCSSCDKVDVRLDKAKTHWKNKHERDGVLFQPRKVEKPVDARAAALYDAALRNRNRA
ncbi:Putative Zinc finger C2H2-type [Septoria linicola]|uniref:Zinc finger C2H2-type n=1 Tax=Septoria linicola TaxID=215465 RepID=A0A9Q9EMW5_9PEZI|nr:putative Zinc finger C2H2-type [Septoria linicola]USW54888.1 Putative Zinc finger C2H2-type [Septoria linicola]